jgi:hypothetical protein
VKGGCIDCGEGDNQKKYKECGSLYIETITLSEDKEDQAKQLNDAAYLKLSFDQ